MAFDITKKSAAATGTIELKDGSGAPLLDDAGAPLTVTVHSPASKAWQQANAEKNRRQAERMRKAGGRAEALLDGAREDQIEFLTRITIGFNGLEYPGAGKTPGEQARAIYDDDALGFIRDHVFAEANDWAAFTSGSAKS